MLNRKPAVQLYLHYKHYAIPFWILYNYLWWVVTLGNPLKAAISLLQPAYTIQFLFYVCFQAAAGYFNLYFLMPRFLEKNRIIVYIVCLLGTILCTALLIIPGYYLGSVLTGKPLAAIYGSDADCFNHFFGIALPSTTAAMTLAMSIQLTVQWIQSRRRQQLLEKEKLETELRFLKNQFNPHFLFNTINAIFFLIHKNPGQASASLAKFSELLRYQLYECNDLQIPLSRECTYIHNFIELEKLRQNSNTDIILQLPAEQGEQLTIAPFILMSFIENAFKHVSRHTDSPNWIKINIQLTNQLLLCSIANSSLSLSSNDTVRYGGIGLQNVRRRLELLYPGQYTLHIKDNKSSFEVALRLQLQELRFTENFQKSA